jgi:hypothetical protein
MPYTQFSELYVIVMCSKPNKKKKKPGNLIFSWPGGREREWEVGLKTKIEKRNHQSNLLTLILLMWRIG